MAYTRMNRAIAVAASPLPDFFLKLAPGAELVHRSELKSLGQTYCNCGLTIRLSPDRRSLTVTWPPGTISSDQLRLVRLEAADQFAGEVTVLVVLGADNPTDGSGQFFKRFQAAELVKLSNNGDLCTIAAGAREGKVIDGITLRPANDPQSVDMCVPVAIREPQPSALADARKGASPPVINLSDPKVAEDQQYVRDRLMAEIAATLSSQQVSVASVHIKFANLYASRLVLPAEKAEHSS